MTRSQEKKEMKTQEDERLTWLLPKIDVINKTRDEELSPYLQTHKRWLVVLRDLIANQTNPKVLVDLAHFLIDEYDAMLEYEKRSVAKHFDSKAEQVGHYLSREQLMVESKASELLTLTPAELKELTTQMPRNSYPLMELWKKIVQELADQYELNRNAAVEDKIRAMKEMIDYIWNSMIDTEEADYCAWCNRDIDGERMHLDVCRMRATMTSRFGQRILENHQR